MQAPPRSRRILPSPLSGRHCPGQRRAGSRRLELDGVRDPFTRSVAAILTPPPLAGIETSSPRARRSAVSIARVAITSAIARRYRSEARTSEIGAAASAAARAAGATESSSPVDGESPLGRGDAADRGARR